jgi:hypothetical protein
LNSKHRKQRLKDQRKDVAKVEKVGLEFSRLHPSRVVEASVVRHFAALLSLAILCHGSDALARNPRDAFNQFAGISQSVVTKAVQAEWRKPPDAETTCVEQNLRPGRSSISALPEHGIPTSDGGAVPDRASCRIQMAQSTLLTELTSAPMDPFSVDGLTLGSKVPYGNPAYQQYQCVPSQKFEEFVWCTKTINDKEPRGRFKAWFSFLRAEDGAVVYVNRYQEPAYWSANEVADDIHRYSRKFGEEPHIIQLPVRPGLPKGTLATWGKVVLEPILGDELRLLAEDKPLKKGIAIDFIGNFSQSARQGLPIYRLAGGPGFVWAASYNQSGRGTFRFSAVDASTYSPPSSPSAATTPLPVADPLGGAAIKVDAQPTSPPGATPLPVEAATPPPHRGEQSDCSVAPDCVAPALASVLAPPRDSNDVIFQVLNYSTTHLQQTDPADGAGQYGRESAASNFRSREWEQRMLDLVVTYWVWLILAVVAGSAAGYLLTRPQITHDRWVRGWLGGPALVLAIGLVVAILQWLPGQAGLYFDPPLFLSFWCITGFLAGAWLRGTRTGTQVVAARAAEDARRAAEAAAEDPRRVAEAKTAEDPEANAQEARHAAEELAAEKARHLAEAWAAEEGRRLADARAAEEARPVAEARTADDARPTVRVKADEKTHRPAEAQAAEEARGVANAKGAGDARRAAKAKGTKKAASVLKAKAVAKTKSPGKVRSKARAAKEAGGAAEAKAAEEARRIAKRSAASNRPGKSPTGPAAASARRPMQEQ